MYTSATHPRDKYMSNGGRQADRYAMARRRVAMPGTRQLRGLTAAQEANIGLQGAGIAIGATAVAMGAGSFAAAAVPFVGPAIAAITLAISLFNRDGAKKTAATQLLYRWQDLAQQNVDAYLSGPRTQANQQAALANFDQIWAGLQSTNGCGNPQLGDPGKRCIDERGPTGKYSWWPYFHDPIANDPTVIPDPTPASVASGFLDYFTGGPAASSGTTSTAPNYAAAAPLALAFVGFLLLVKS